MNVLRNIILALALVVLGGLIIAGIAKQGQPAPTARADQVAATSPAPATSAPATQMAALPVAADDIPPAFRPRFSWPQSDPAGCDCPLCRQRNAFEESIQQQIQKGE